MPSTQSVHHQEAEAGAATGGGGAQLAGLNFFCYLHFMLQVSCLCTTCVQGPQRPKEGIIFSRTGVTDGCQYLMDAGTLTWVICKSS